MSCPSDLLLRLPTGDDGVAVQGSDEQGFGAPAVHAEGVGELLDTKTLDAGGAH